MATRTISTKLAIDGESEYRASLSRINSEIKTLQSALRLTESQYQTNANSMEALKAKGDALNKLYEAQKGKIDQLRAALDNAKKSIQDHAKEQEAAQKKVDAAKEALEKLKKTEGDTSEEQKRLTEEIKKNEEAVQYHKDAIVSAEKGVNSWQTQLNTAQIKLNDLDAEIKLNGEYLAEAEKSSDHCATSIDRFGERVKETAGKADELATALADAGVIQAVGNLTDGLKECIDEAVKFEAEMAAVGRTTGITNDAAGDAVITLDELADELRQMSAEMPITTSELTAIATTAGQLGIAQGDVASFTRIMAELSTTTDLTADQAATMLAQFSSIVKLDPSNYDRLGSTVAALGDATATTASKIVDMSQGMAAVMSIAGMSEQDILGIAAAVGSMGIEAQSGSTAMNTLVQNIDKAVSTGGEKLYSFAEVAGMSAGQFRAAWEEDAADALNAVITGLGDMEESGGNVNLMLEELGITNARQIKTVMSLAEAGDVLTNTLSMADDAWESNTALTEKAGVMYDTTQAKIDIMNNKVALLKEAIGTAFAPVIADAAEKAGDFAQGLAEYAEEHPQVVQAIGAVVTALAGLTTGLAAFQAAKKAANILELGSLFGKIGSAATSAVTAVEGLAVAIGGSLAAGLGLIAGMAAPVVASIYAIADSIKETKEVGFIGEGKTAQEYADNVEYYRKRIENLKVEYENLSNAGADLTGIQNELDTATIGLKHAEEEQAAAATAAAEAADELAEAEEGVTEATGEADGAAEDVKLSLQELAQAYKDAYEAAGDSISGQIGLFGEFKASLSEDLDEADELIARWTEQAADLETYSENIKWAAETHLRDGLVQALSDGSAESAAYLALIRSEVESSETTIDEFGNASNPAVEKFNAAWDQTTAARENLQMTMAGMQVDLETALADLEAQAQEGGISIYDVATEAFANVGLDFATIASNCDLGFVEGINANMADVKAAVQDLGENAVTGTMRNTVQTHSPSEVFREIGKDVVTGLEQGIEEKSGDAVAAVTSLADALTAKTREKIRELKSAMDSETSSMPGSAYATGQQIVDGMTGGMNSRSGVLYWTISNLVNSAIARARAAAAVASPSKKTTEIFEYVGEGMIVGIENRRKALEDKMQSVVESAMDVDVKNDISDKMTSINDRDLTATYVKSPSEKENASSTTTITRGDTIINVYPREGQDERVLAQELAALINDNVGKEDAAWA